MSTLNKTLLDEAQRIATGIRSTARSCQIMAEESKTRSGIRIAALSVAIGSFALLSACGPRRHIVGSVNTEFNLIGPDHKIVIESYDDPKIDGITVFISKSQKGGIKGGLGLAEDTSDASVAVRQTGPIKVKETFENGEDAFTEARSVLFKRLHVSRFWDASHKSFVYVVWTDRLINGSPQNSISAVVAEPWGSQAPDLSVMTSAMTSATPASTPQ
jgi:CreA protein